MAVCKNCKRFEFISSTPYGVCRSCLEAIVFEAKSLMRVMNESEQIIAKSKKLDTQLSRCDLIIEYSQRLLRYEQMGISITDPKPSWHIRVWQGRRKTLVVNGLWEEYDGLTEWMQNAKTNKVKAAKLSKFVERVEAFRSEVEPGQLDKLLNESSKVLMLLSL